MYKITGKQQFGAVWANGECLAVFHRGAAYTNDTAKVDLLREQGYTVEGSSDRVESDSEEVKDNDSAAEEAPSADEHPPKAAKKKKGE